MSHNKFYLFSFLIITFSAVSSAEEIILLNGDILQGSITEETDSHIIWNADNFGNLSIALDQVLSVNGALLTNNSMDVTQSRPEEEPSAITRSFSGESFSGSTAAFGNMSSGNDERNEWGLEAEMSWLNGDLRHRSALGYESKSADNNQANVKYHLSHSVDWFFKDSWFWSNQGSFGANDNRAIDNFYTLGSNLGNQFWDNDESALLAETGLVWISETFIDGTKDDRVTLSWSSVYRKLLFKKMGFSHSHQLLVSIEDADNSQFSADVGFDFPWINNLFTKISIEWTYDNRPVEGVEKIDRKLNLGLNYSW